MESAERLEERLAERLAERLEERLAERLEEGWALSGALEAWKDEAAVETRVSRRKEDEKKPAGWKEEEAA